MNERPRRVLILQAAGRLFGHYGPLKTTVADIAREARVGVGTVYLEFRSKDAILEVLSGNRHESVLDAQRRAWASEGGARTRLERVLDARFEAFLATAERDPHGRDLFRCASPAVEQAHRAFQREEHAQLAGFLAEARGELRVGDPERDAGTLLLAYCAFAPPHVFEAPPDRLRGALSRMHPLVLRGLEP
jgi:AcrR family transcriptional regulator